MHLNLAQLVKSGLSQIQKESKQLVLAQVVTLPMSFFDSQPTGRLLNRFSRDTEALDVTLGNTVQSFLGCLTSVLVSMLVVLVVTPAVLLSFVPLAFIYNRVQARFPVPPLYWLIEVLQEHKSL